MTGDRQGVARRALKGSLIRALRDRRGLTQAQVAAGLDKALGKAKPTGCSYISMLECDRRKPSVQTLSGLAEVLECEPADFFGEPEPQVPEVQAESQAMIRESEPRLSRPLPYHLAYHRATSGDYAASLYSFASSGAPALCLTFQGQCHIFRTG